MDFMIKETLIHLTLWDFLFYVAICQTKCSTQPFLQRYWEFVELLLYIRNSLPRQNHSWYAWKNKVLKLIRWEVPSTNSFPDIRLPFRNSTIGIKTFWIIFLREYSSSVTVVLFLYQVCITEFEEIVNSTYIPNWIFMISFARYKGWIYIHTVRGFVFDCSLFLFSD